MPAVWVPRHHGIVGEMIDQQRQRQLARLRPLIAPLETVLGELHDVKARIKRCAIHGHLYAVDGPVSQVTLHSALLSLDVGTHSSREAASILPAITRMTSRSRYASARVPANITSPLS